jgi:plastocyanin
MPFRSTVMVAVCAVVLALAPGVGAVDQSVTALSGPNRFSNNDVTITQGEKVTFTNGGTNHNVHFDNNSVDYPAEPTSDAWTTTVPFNAVGEFRYYCDAHGSPGGGGMSGIVRVVAAPSGPPPGGGPPQQEPGGGSPDPEPGGPAPGGQSPGGDESELKVTLKVSDTTPLAGKRVRLFGVVTPAADGRKVQIQKRLRNGQFKTIATTRLHAAKGDKSTYSLKLRLSKDTALRARVAGAEKGVSKTRKLDVHQAA